MDLVCPRIPRNRQPVDKSSVIRRLLAMPTPAPPSLPRELWDFLRHSKKWWLGPIVLVLVLFGALVFFTQGSAVAPFIYTIF